uniref:Carboxylic ester hydrolase n=1 Tax=Plectus sambesii TaxID=2011161 RepID=A0A914WR09_9BILA
MELPSFLQFIFLCTVVCSVSAADSTVSVQIGGFATVIGYTQTNPDGFAFYGIPYAQPPTGQNRFAPTQRKDPSGRILAFHFGAACHQAATAGSYDEDCLFLNIWTPKMSNFTNNKYPVLFWIHGGGFVIGSGNLDTEGILKNLVSRGIIVVSINYRLGAFGFFSSRDSAAPGNMGMLDQIEALNWVKRYISYFGGDPNAVTIDGESAGGESVSLLTLSPLTNGLFIRAIVESGSAFSPGVISYSDTQTDTSKQAAVKLNCITAAQWDSHSQALITSMLQCLRQKTVADIETFWGGWDGWERWGPVGDHNVFPDRLENLALKRGPIPVIIGNCKDEWLNTYKDPLQHDPTFAAKFTRQSQIDELLQHYELNFYNNSAIVRQQAQATYIDNKPYADQDHVSWIVDNIQ